MDATQYPEAEKWAKVHSDAVTIRAFIDWANDKYSEIEYWLRPPLDEQLYEYFGIDADKLEQERRKMLEALNA